MPSNLDFLAFQIARLSLAYLLHSTVLLAGTWILLRAARVRSWALRERMWKLAVILPFFTAAIPLPASWSRPATWLHFEQLASRVPSTESNIAHVEESQPEPIVEVELASDEATTLNMDEAARAAEPGRLAEYGDGQPTLLTNGPPREGGPAAEAALSHPTTASATLEVERTTVAPGLIRAVCYVVLTFFVLGALHVIRRSLVFARSLRECRPIEDKAICGVLADVLRRANVRRRVRLLKSAADRPPAAFGLIRWTVVLPQALIPTLKPDELRALLGHEVAHLARGDALWLWIGRILCACFAFQPLNFLARAQLRLAAEFLCDEWAVRNSANRFALARCLTRVAEWSAHLAPQSLELAAVGHRSNLSDRVERLVLGPGRADFWGSGRRRWLVWAAAFAAAFGLECAAPRTGLLAEPLGRTADRNPQTTDHGQADSPLLEDALRSLSDETRDLLSELQRVNSLLRQSTSRDPAIAARLEAQAARLADRQAQLVRLQKAARASQPSSLNQD